MCAACTVSIRESDPCVCFPSSPCVDYLVTGPKAEKIQNERTKEKTVNSIEIRDYL